MAGIEELDEEEIVQLKENAQEQVDTLDDQLEERGEKPPETGSRSAA